MEKPRRNTVQRQLVYDAVAALNIHASAEEVYAYVIQKHPSISKATVYRNLSQLAESGELLNIGDFDKIAHYDHNCHTHYHFMCVDCKRIFDVEGDFSAILGKTADVQGFDVMDYHLTFSGLCWACKRKQPERA